MADLSAYERDPYLTRLEAEVLQVGSEGARPYAVLSDTLFYPEGGGQPADHGFLGERAVLDVAKRDGELRHYLDGPAVPGPVRLRLDWRRRFDHMQQHTGQHLLTAVAQDQFGWATTAFHLGEQVADIELATPLISGAELERLEEAVAAEIRAARPVSARRVSPEDYQALKVRSRGLPEGFQGEIRLVEIAGVDLNTCGGTHLAGTGELEALKLLGSEAIRGGTRLFFVAGGRTRQRLGAHERRNAQLRTALGAPDEGLLDALQVRLEQLRGLERRVRSLEEELAEGAAAALAAAPEAFVERHFEGRDAGFLQKVGRSLVAAAPAKLALLTAGGEGGACFLLIAGEDCPVELPALGRDLAGLLQAKGGGSGKLFQGKASSLAGREQAVLRARAASA